MKPENVINMIKRFTDSYGVTVFYNEQVVTLNSRGREVTSNTGDTKTVKVLLLKEKINLLQEINTEAIGLTQDYSRYILTLPEIDIKKDMIITDNHGMKWKLGIIDWFDIGETVVAKQAPLIRMD